MQKQTHRWIYLLATAITGIGLTSSAQATSVQQLGSGGNIQASTSIVMTQATEPQVTLATTLLVKNEQKGGIAASSSLNLQQADIYYSQGVSLQQQGKLSEAIAQYRQAIRLNPKLAEAYLNIGAALAAQGKHQEAIAQYQTALRLNPVMPEAHFNLGNALAQQGEFEKAIAQYREAIRLHPTYAKAYYNLGNVLAQQEQKEAAIAQWQQAIRIQPEFAEAYANIGVTLSRAGQRKAAAEALTKARDLFKAQGKADQAERIEQILQRVNTNPSVITRN